MTSIYKEVCSRVGHPYIETIFALINCQKISSIVQFWCKDVDHYCTYQWHWISLGTLVWKGSQILCARIWFGVRVSGGRNLHYIFSSAQVILLVSLVNHAILLTKRVPRASKLESWYQTANLRGNAWEIPEKSGICGNLLAISVPSRLKWGSKIFQATAPRGHMPFNIHDVEVSISVWGSSCIAS